MVPESMKNGYGCECPDTLPVRFEFIVFGRMKVQRVMRTVMIVIFQVRLHQTFGMRTTEQGRQAIKAFFPECLDDAFGDRVLCALIRRSIFSGEKPDRQLIAPVGSTRSGAGGDKCVEAHRDKAT